MLNKSDLKAIGVVFDEAFDRKFAKALSRGLGDFFDHVIVPYFDARLKENDEDHDEIFRKLDRNQEEHDEMFVRLDQNEKDHKKIFVKLDLIEEKVDGHETRIKKLEKTFQTS